MRPLLSYCAALLLLLFLGVPSGLAQQPQPSAASAQATIRVGDTLDIRLSGVVGEEGALTGTQVVDDNGMVNIAYIGKLKVSGLDSSEAQHLIEGKLKSDKIYTNPTITVTVQANRYVNVSGEVKSAGRLTYTADLSVLTSISGAGGFTDFADKKRVKLTRNGTVQEIDTTKISKDPSKDVKVLPGDLIFVPQSGTFSW